MIGSDAPLACECKLGPRWSDVNWLRLAHASKNLASRERFFAKRFDLIGRSTLTVIASNLEVASENY
jgi:hypothetical protein